MRRLLRWSFNLSAAVSLLLFAAICVLWVRSYRPGEPAAVELWAGPERWRVFARDGRLVVAGLFLRTYLAVVLGQPSVVGWAGIHLRSHSGPALFRAGQLARPPRHATKYCSRRSTSDGPLAHVWRDRS